MKRVAIILELKSRELGFLAILQRKLEMLGHDVRIIPQRLLCGTALLLFRPDIILVNGLRSDRNFIKQILIPKRLFGATVISFYSEQVGKREGLADTYDVPHILAGVDAHIVWGDAFARGLLALGVPRERIWILGALSFDLLFALKSRKEPIRRMLAESYGLDPMKPWILVSDNIIRQANPQLFEQRRSEFDAGIALMAARLPECEVIFRSHPDAAEADLHATIRQLSRTANVRAVAQHHVYMWIVQAAAMVIYYSTSAIEAWVAGTEVFALNTSDGEMDYWHSGLTANFQSPAHLAQELARFVRGGSTGGDFGVARGEYLDEWFTVIDGRTSDRVCALIAEVSRSEPVNGHADHVGWWSIVGAYVHEYPWYIVKVLKGQRSRFRVSKAEMREALSFVEVNGPDVDTYAVRDHSYGRTIELQAVKDHAASIGG